MVSTGKLYPGDHVVKWFDIFIFPDLVGYKKVRSTARKCHGRLVFFSPRKCDTRL